MASTTFTCNVCGASCERSAEPPGREVPSCAQCGSTVRLRALVALLSREIFGLELALPDMPALKSVRGFGMSDPPILAVGLAEKFSYTNTFYHQPPVLDISKPPEEELGTYDFIVSSEVMEHVPPPVEQGFANLYRLLKPNGLLLLTVPYAPWPQHTEHYPELHEYVLASPGGRTVLVNRRRDGSIQIFENLSFHGGDGSTLEMRVFSEDSLKGVLSGAGFDEVHIASENVPELGVDHAETWSLPIVARKGKFQLPGAEVMQAYVTASQRVSQVERELDVIRGEYTRFVAFHEQSDKEMKQTLAERTEQAARDLEVILGEYKRYIAFHEQSHQEMKQMLAERAEQAEQSHQEMKQELAERTAEAQRDLEAIRGEYTRYVAFHEQSHQEMKQALAERTEQAERDLEAIRGEYTRYIAFHEQSHQEMKQALAERTEQAERDLEAIRGDYTRYIAFHEQSHQEMKQTLEERATWAQGLDRELSEAHARRAQLERDLTEVRAQKAEMESRLWVKVGRKLGGV